VIIGNGLAGLWSLGAWRLPSLRTRALWWFTVIAELTVFVQVALGVELVAGEKIEAVQFHMFYGFGGLFVMGLGIRALLVGARG
jgi:hypothetical protein